MAQLMDVIDRHPLGFDGGVGAKGSAISVGQRQRVAIARAIARKPELLIFGKEIGKKCTEVLALMIVGRSVSLNVIV